MTNFYKKNHVVLIAIVLAMMIWAISLMAIHMSYTNAVSDHIDSEIILMDSSINSITKTYEEFSAFFFESSINRAEVLDILEKVGETDNNQKDQLRSDLYDVLEKEYKLLQKYNFRQLHFHLKNGDSFLRFHAPEQYGDNLLEIRDSIRIANTENRYVYGFEEGRVFNGYRFVYPLNHNNNHIGSVEVSISLSAVIETLNNLYPNINYFFILKKEVVEDTVFIQNQDNYSVSPIFENYLIDKEVEQSVLNIDDEIRSLNDEIFKEIIRNNALEKLRKNEVFGFNFNYLDKNYLVRFHPINNIANVTVGYYYSITEDEHCAILKDQMVINVILMTLSVLILIGSFIALNRNRMKLQNMAETDKLTGAYNRHHFVTKSEKELLRSLRYHGNFCIVLLDIDHFKKVNDSYGHQAGDSVLMELTRLITHTLRATDIFARWGGEEFIALLPETDIEQGVKAAERLRIAVEAFQFKPVGNITISLGISHFLESDQNIDEIIKRADDALYEAKRTGRNRVISG
ncbi:MAG: diguanylate cyclase [Leptolinea sp.]|nr:diguanylate cyclase [Leptolinea sp.]